jgi:hypothetical protein
LLVAPEANEGAEYAKSHPQAPWFRAKEYCREGEDDLTAGDAQEHQRSIAGPFAAKAEPLPARRGCDKKVQGNPIDQETYENGESPQVVPRMVIDRAARATDGNKPCQDASDGHRQGIAYDAPHKESIA